MIDKKYYCERCEDVVNNGIKNRNYFKYKCKKCKILTINTPQALYIDYKQHRIVKYKYTSLANVRDDGSDISVYALLEIKSIIEDFFIKNNIANIFEIIKIIAKFDKNNIYS